MQLHSHLKSIHLKQRLKSEDQFIEPKQFVGQQTTGQAFGISMQWQILDYRICLSMVAPCVFTGQAQHSSGEKADQCGRELIMDGKK